MVYQSFLKNHNLVLVMDPPFGGKVDVLCYTLEAIRSDYRRINANDSLNISSKFSTMLSVQSGWKFKCILASHSLLGVSLFHGASDRH